VAGLLTYCPLIFPSHPAVAEQWIYKIGLDDNLQLREQFSNYTKFPFNPKRVWNQRAYKGSSFWEIEKGIFL